MDVGFIRLGHMGSAMARNLLKAGRHVTLYNRTRAKAGPLVAAGARVVDKPSAACGGDVLITMLADDHAVETVVFGQEGVVAALPPNAIHVSMSTISVALSDRLAEAHARAGRGYVAAPVFGRPEAAAAAQLFIIAAGGDEAIRRCQPLFDAIGQKDLRRRRQAIGGQPRVKLSGNFLITSIIESLGEAFALVRKSGVDPHRYLEILTGTLFSAPVYKTYGGLIAEEKYEPAGFKMALGLKDIRLALAAADAQAVPMPVASLVHDHFLAGVAQGQGDSDWSALARLAAANAGL